MLENKIVFITGGAKGIGYGIACAALEAGAQVAIGDLDEQAVSAARGSLISETSVSDKSVLQCLLTSLMNNLSNPH